MLNDEIQRIVKDEINQIAFPTIVTITKIYADGYVDVEGNLGSLRHIYSITQHNVGDKTILIFAEGDFNQQVVI